MIEKPRLVIDISLWDDHLNVPLLKEAGVAGAIVKCGQAMRRDPKYEAHAQAIVDGGLLLMAYYWDDIICDPVAQAEWVAKDLKETGFPVKYIWADQEQWWTNWQAWMSARKNEIPYSEIPHASADAISQHNRIFAETMYGLCPQFGLYSNYGFVTSWAPSIKNWIGDYTLWIAHYGHQPKAPMDITWAQLQKEWMPDYKLLYPPGSKEEKIVGHQFTGNVFRLPGVYDANGKTLVLDVNIFSEDFLLAIADGVVVPTVPDTSDPSTPAAGAGEYFVNVSALNVRKGPGTQYDIVGLLIQNTTVQVVEIQGNWAHLDTDAWVYAPYLTAGEPATPVPTPSTDTKDYYVNVPAVNVRKGPGTQYAIVGIFQKNTAVKVVKIEGYWANLDNTTWIYAPYLTAGTPSTSTSSATTTPTEADVYYVNVPAVNIRQGPGTQYNIVNILKKNTAVKAIEIQGYWAHLDNNTWVYAPYLSSTVT